MDKLLGTNYSMNDMYDEEYLDQLKLDKEQEQAIIMANVRRWQKAKKRRAMRRFNSVGQVLDSAINIGKNFHRS